MTLISCGRVVNLETTERSLLCAWAMTAQHSFNLMQLWELINADTWLRHHIADNGKGLLVSPHSSKAKRFSLLGGLIHCHIPCDQVWTPEFEDVRSSIFASIVANKVLRTEVKRILGHNSLSKISLYELNTLATWPFIFELLTTLESISKNR